MKRIQSACLNQTIHFQLKDDIEHSLAVSSVQAEYDSYKAALDQNHTKYKILEEAEQDDGSIRIKIKRQYNHYDSGDYLS